MKKYKFLFDPQNGSYMGLVREPFPDNCTSVHPHFSLGFKTCWDFNGRWVLVREDKFFDEITRRDVLKDYDLRVLEVLANHRMLDASDRDAVLREVHGTGHFLANKIVHLIEEQKKNHVITLTKIINKNDYIIQRLHESDHYIFNLQNEIQEVLRILQEPFTAKMKRVLRSASQKLLRSLGILRD